MENDKRISERKLNELEIKHVLRNSTAWSQIISALKENQQDIGVLDTLLSEVAEAVEKAADAKYVKRTFELREDLFDEMRVWAVRHGMTQKTFLNMAIEAFLDLHRDNKEKK